MTYQMNKYLLRGAIQDIQITSSQNNDCDVTIFMT